MNVTDILGQIDLFRDMDAVAIGELAIEASVRRLAAREILFHEGDEGNHFFILREGSVRAYKTSPGGKESTIKIIHAGEFFAETVLFGVGNYPATAVAATDSIVVSLHRQSFLAMLDRREWRDIFIAACFGKMRYLTDTIHHLSSHDVEGRFFMFLLNTYGRRDCYEIPLPKKDIASAIGTMPETFSRMIQRLSAEGTIRWERSTLTLRSGFWYRFNEGGGEYDGAD
ncbi:MAG: Crp/Fnr family transcriptional regulator [Spirochaetes bacterium]|nr:Crp/Fnr family transcriptional regulator [Spirochaetota bacterium]